MQIPLNQFEQIIDETILKRGLQYFKNGNVHEPEEINSGEYEAVVEGTDDYTVRLSIRNGIINEYVCDCPYDMGPICKHVTAVIFYLQKDVLDLKTKTKKVKSEQTTEPVKRKTVAEKVDDILEKATHEELKRFIRENVAYNPSFRESLLESFPQNKRVESKEFYAKQVKSILKSASGKHNFINWSAASIVGNNIDKLIESAKNQVNIKNYKSAIYICTAVMEQMTEALQYSDDSNGDIGGAINSAYETLGTIAHEQISEEIRKLMIDYCFSAFEKRIFSGWDWHIGVIHLSVLLLKTEEEYKKVIELISTTHMSKYEKEESQSIMYNILLDFEGEASAENYLEQNLSNTKLRRKAIQNAMENKNYEKAISLANDGINHNMKDSPGYVKEWYDWLLKIAQAQNDSAKIIEYARLLLIDNYRNTQDYYKILKQQIKPEDWKSFIEKVILDLTEKNSWLDMQLITSIFIKEEWWDRLFEFVKISPSLGTIEENEKYLAKNYSNEIVELYANGIIENLKLHVGRTHYKNACRYIRKIIKLGARDKANEIISFLKAEYPQRKALIEELEMYNKATSCSLDLLPVSEKCKISMKS